MRALSFQENEGFENDIDLLVKNANSDVCILTPELIELIQCSVSDKMIEKELSVSIALAYASQSSPFQVSDFVIFKKTGESIRYEYCICMSQ